ncbi:MAG: hypothetical protein KDA63_05630 [Planctomycetales bacterium]|nr:hypothetical protein [Planctomycetales bacterium]
MNPAQFVMTTFADDLSFPLGMAALDDGSLLVGVSEGSNFYGATTGQIVRLVDGDGDGVAESRSTVVADVPGGKLTSLRVWNDLVFVTGQAKPISIYRIGENPADAYSLVGSINIAYPSGGGWTHRHSALQVRDTPGTPDSVDLLFQLGSDSNYGATTRTAQLTSSANLGLSATLSGEALHMLTIADDGTELSGVGHVQLASGVRNGAGMAFHPATGDLWFDDNGIDGFVDPNEPTSADELNRIALADIGGAIEDFGFYLNYTEYRTGDVVGGAGVQPIVAFQPYGDPFTGDESEGANDIAFAPPAFPEGLNDGVFIGFHGRASLGGVSNEENPVVFYDLATDSYFHFIGVDQAAIGHLDGVISTYDSLFLADIDPDGSLVDDSAGVIYKIRARTPGDANDDGRVDGLDYLVWAEYFGDDPAEDPPGAPANGDLNFDGVVDGLDYLEWASNFGQGPNDALAVPEPAAALFAWGGLMVVVFSRGRHRHG